MKERHEKVIIVIIIGTGRKVFMSESKVSGGSI
jgi:hypothetical protein